MTSLGGQKRKRPKNLAEPCWMKCDALFTNRLLWLGRQRRSCLLRGSGCRNLAPPGVYEQALT